MTASSELELEPDGTVTLFNSPMSLNSYPKPTNVYAIIPLVAARSLPRFTALRSRRFRPQELYIRKPSPYEPHRTRRLIRACWAYRDHWTYTFSSRLPLYLVANSWRLRFPTYSRWWLCGDSAGRAGRHRAYFLPHRIALQLRAQPAVG